MKPTPLALAEPIPHVCKVGDVLRILQISRATFGRLMARGALPLVEIAKLDAHRRFTGESVQACKRGRFAAQKLRRVPA